jgi:hypothetical protein
MGYATPETLIFLVYRATETDDNKMVKIESGRSNSQNRQLEKSTIAGESLLNNPMFCYCEPKFSIDKTSIPE